MNYIEIQGLTKVLQGNVVLNNINLTIDKGSIIGFVGKNGSGKTMLFRAICGLIQPDKGKVLLNGKKIGKDYKFLPNTGLLIENIGLYEHLSAFENLKLLNRISKNKLSDHEIKMLIKEFGLNPDDNKTFKKFSLGMKQRLCLAQAFMGNPNILILDEPTNALDKNGVVEIEKLIISEKDKGKTILVSSHDEKYIKNISDKIYYMYEGHLSDKEL